MSEFDPQRHWEGVYRSRPETELSWYEASPETSYTAVLELVPERHARIVDVGGGTSRLAEMLVEAGYKDVCVLDISGQALELSRQRMGDRAEKVTWIEGSVLEWQPDSPVQLWHDRAVYHFFTDAADRAAYARTAAAAVERGGFVLMETFAPDGPSSCSGLAVYRAAPEEIASQFAPEFRLQRSSRHEHRTPSGAVQRFQAVVLQRV